MVVAAVVEEKVFEKCTEVALIEASACDSACDTGVKTVIVVPAGGLRVTCLMPLSGIGSGRDV